MAEPTREELALLVDQLRVENATQAKMIEELRKTADLLDGQLRKAETRIEDLLEQRGDI